VKWGAGESGLVERVGIGPHLHKSFVMQSESRMQKFRPTMNRMQNPSPGIDGSALSG
jgi:hypothetical protein